MTQTYDYDWREDVEEQPTEDNEPIEVQAIAPSTQVQDDDDDYEIEPPRKLIDRPVLLIAIVSGGLLGGVIILVGVIWAATSVSGFVSSEKTKDRVTAETAAINSPFDREDSISETEQLRQRLSSKNRDAEVAAFNQQAKDTKAPPTPTPSPTPIAKITTPQRTVQAPKVIYRPAPPKSPPQKKVAPPPPAPRPAPRQSPVAAPKPVVRPKKPIDPFEQWEKLANLGSIGGGDIVATASPGAYSDQSALYVDPTGGPAVPVFNPLADSEAEAYETSETPASPFSLALGTTIKGKLLHDITFVDGSISTETAVVELMERMGTIPQGAMVSTQINGVDDSGALSMDILGYEVDGEYSSVSLPEIQVTSAPASTNKNGLDRLFRDVAGIGLDILSNEAGQNVEIEFDDLQISSISTNSSSGLLDRSVEAVSSRLLERNRSRSSNKKAPKVKRGSTVRFIVVQPMG